MDFDAAIAAHARWKYRLSDYAEGKSAEQLDAATVARDDRCDLGAWIASAGAGIAELREAHAAFHRAAGAVVAKCQAGEQQAAIEMLGRSSEYGQCSTKVIMLIKVARDAAIE